jgi:RNA polymerase-binding transcription factor DksA
MNTPAGSKPARPAPAQSASRAVRFLTIQPEAHEVFVAGDFNNWNAGATPLIYLGHGCWVKDISLPPGRHEYQFIVDGHWMQDRTAAELVDNPVGGLNSVVIVPRPQYNPTSFNSTPKRLNRKWRWHYQALLKLREFLLNERALHRGDAARPLEPGGMDLADTATDESSRDLALFEISAEQDELYEVEEAITRILDGTYGRCQQSGRPLSPARLRAIPWARFSKEVEEGREEMGRGNLCAGML